MSEYHSSTNSYVPTIEDRVTGDICHVVSPSEFFARSEADERLFLDLKEKMARYYYNQGGTRAITALKRKEYGAGDVIAVYDHGRYLRGRLVKSRQDNDQLDVFLIDVGKTLVNFVAMANVFKIDRAFHWRKAMCFRCHLSDVEPKSGGEMWSEEAVRFFKETTRRIPIGETVVQTRGAEVEVADGCVSRPVDVIFEDEVTDSIFAPSNRRTYSVSSLLMKKGFAQALTLEDEEEELMEDALSDFTDSDSPHGMSFEEELAVVDKWPLPLIPTASEFKARPTYVDDEGQIYVVRKQDESVLHKMNEAFAEIVERKGDELLKDCEWATPTRG